MTVQDLEALEINPSYARDTWVHAHCPVGRGVLQKRTWDAAIAWVIETRVAFPWGELTERTAIEQLRLGARSIYYPDFREDPVIIADCPNDGQRVTVGKEGFCDACGYDFTR